MALNVQTRKPGNKLIHPRGPMPDASVLGVILTLLALGAASASLYYWGKNLGGFPEPISTFVGLYILQLAIYLMACYVVFRHPVMSSRAVSLTMMGIVLIFAAAFHIALVEPPPYLSADVYRYVWDGRVQTAGINPYRYRPKDEELNLLRDDAIYPKISREDRKWITPYPPVAQAIFFGIYNIRPRVSAIKIAMSLLDIVAVLAIMLVLARSNINPAHAIIFAWHPLIIFEAAHSGHIDSAFIAFLALALLAWSHRKYALTGVAIGMATLVKFYPALLLPVFFLAKHNESYDFCADHKVSHENLNVESRGKPGNLWALTSIQKHFNKQNRNMVIAFVSTIVLAYLPYLSVGWGVLGSLGYYIHREGFCGAFSGNGLDAQGTRYYLLDLASKVIHVPTAVFVILAALALGVLAFRRLVRVKLDAVDVARGALALIGPFLVLTSPRYPWYYSWILPFLCFVPRLGWLYLASAAALLHLLWYTPVRSPNMPLWLGTALIVPTLLFLIWERWRQAPRADLDTRNWDAAVMPSLR